MSPTIEYLARVRLIEEDRDRWQQTATAHLRALRECEGRMLRCLDAVNSALGSPSDVADRELEAALRELDPAHMLAEVPR